MKPTDPGTGTPGRLHAALARLPEADCYAMLGVRFSLTTDDVAVRDFFRATYRHFACAQAPEAGGLRLAAVLHPGEGGPFAAAGPRELDLAGRAMPVNRAFLFLLNALMDAVGDYLLVHGAAVCVNGQGIILAGPPTAGKSTLVLELARRGAIFLSDDVAPLDRVTGRLHPFPRAIGIRKEGAGAARIDIGALPPESVHSLAYKWLVDPVALGLRLAGAQETPCRVHAVVLLDGDDGDPDSARPEGRRAMEIALAEQDPALLAELRAVRWIHDIRPLAGRPFPVFGFEVERSERPMRALADLARRRRDVVLYVDEARPSAPARAEEPILREMRWPPLLLRLARDLLNRSETSELMASCGALPGLISELGRLLEGARAYRLRPGRPERTADAILGAVISQAPR